MVLVICIIRLLDRYFEIEGETIEYLLRSLVLKQIYKDHKIVTKLYSLKFHNSSDSLPLSSSQVKQYKSLLHEKSSGKKYFQILRKLTDMIYYLFHIQLYIVFNVSEKLKNMLLSKSFGFHAIA